MKILLKISILLLLLSACKEPSVVGPGDKVVDDKLEYEIIASSNLGIEPDTTSEFIVRNNEELTELITNKSDSYNLPFIDKLLDIDFSNKTLVIITHRTEYSNSTITIDSLYINKNGGVELNYTIKEVGSRANKIDYVSVALLINKKITQRLQFNKQLRRVDDYVFDGFRTIATDIAVNTRSKWKEVFQNRMQFLQWANKVGLQDTTLLDSVDFSKQTLISVGTGYFTSGEYRYSISEIQQQLGALYVASEFTVGNHLADVYQPANHFVVINKTNRQVRFKQTEVYQDDDLGFSTLYYENMRSLKVVSKNTATDSLTITKVNNPSELIDLLPLSNELNPANLPVDFEFFDLLVIRTEAMTAESVTTEVAELRENNGKLSGRLNLKIKRNQNGIEYSIISIIKVIKTDTELDSNFGVTIQ